MRTACSTTPIWLRVYNFVRYLLGVLLMILTEVSFAYQILVQLHYQIMLKLDYAVTSVYNDRQNAVYSSTSVRTVSTEASK